MNIKQTKRMELAEEYMRRTPKYSVGDIVKYDKPPREFEILEVYNDLQIRYLCMSIKYGYKEMMFECDINGKKKKGNLCYRII